MHDTYSIPDAVGDNYGAWELAKRMSERGHQTSIITWNKNDPSSKRIENIEDVKLWTSKNGRS